MPTAALLDTDAAKAAVVEDVWRARVAEHAAHLDQLRLGLAWARLHPVAVDCDGAVDDYAGWGDPGLLGTGDTALLPLAGAGAPLVSVQAPLELAAALDRPLDHARQLLGDALELAYRLPRLWALAQDHRVPVWLARRVSRETRDLTRAAAAHADQLLCAVPERISRVDAARLVHEARLCADPDRAVAEEEAAAAGRGVWLRRDGRAPGVTDVHMTLEADDADLLDATIGRIADDLRDLGDTSSRDERRASAVGVLADPQHALDLMSGRSTAADPRCGGLVDLAVHLTPADLVETDPGVAVVERRGAVGAGQLARWVRRRSTTGGRVRVRAVVDRSVAGPVPEGVRKRVDDLVRAWLEQHGIDTCLSHPADIALADVWSVDVHDPPPRMREQVVLRDAHCVFPGCRRDSRSCDLDHLVAYDPGRDGLPGPPGQTTPVNLAPLCRRHHNAKTHGGWSYRRRDDGSYVWRSPTATPTRSCPTAGPRCARASPGPPDPDRP